MFVPQLLVGLDGRAAGLVVDDEGGVRRGVGGGARRDAGGALRDAGRLGGAPRCEAGGVLQRAGRLGGGLRCGAGGGVPSAERVALRDGRLVEAEQVDLALQHAVGDGQREGELGLAMGI